MAGKFETAAWVATANIYEVNTRQYTPEGTFAAFQPNLQRVRDMGIDILWFMPITPISYEKRQGTLGSYYACSNYTEVNKEFGSLDDFKKLVNEAHKLGFKVIIDWVANHTGCDHVWTKEHPEYYKKDGEGKFYETHGWADVIDLDYGNHALWEAMTEAMNFWLKECDIDGFRCDMAHLVPLDFWSFARTELEQQKRLFWLAECEEPAYHQVFDATYTWEFLHTAEALYKGEVRLQNLKDVLAKYDATFPVNALRAFFTTNHDENSHSGSEYERLGNSAQAFAVLCATWKNSLPLIYSGQELPNKKRLKFFDKDVIDWNGQYRLNDFYRSLLVLKKNCSALRSGDESVNTKVIETNNPDNIFVFLHQKDTSEVLVMLNLSPWGELYFNMIGSSVSGKYINRFSPAEMEISDQTTFQMQPWEYLVFYKI